tara:strand:+ start:2338 stop:2520 length:183 start_codon:yes stop_codon:yes gene_type:complete
MPYGPGTYGSKVGRPKKKNTAAKPAKRLTTGQKKIARQAGNPNKIDAADFKKLRSRRGMK